MDEFKKIKDENKELLPANVIFWQCKKNIKDDNFKCNIFVKSSLFKTNKLLPCKFYKPISRHFELNNYRIIK